MGIILSHNISALIVMFLLSLWFTWELIRSLLRQQVTEYIMPLISIVLLSFGLSAFFSFPASLEAHYTKVEQLATGTNDYHNHFVYLEQLADSPWGYGGSTQGRVDGMSFKIGKLHLVTLGLVLILFFFKKNLFKNRTYEVVLFTTAFLLSIFMMLSISTQIWELLPLFNFVQYPWRFLTITVFFISLLCGFFDVVLDWFGKRLSIIGIVILLTLLIGIHTKYFQPQLINTKTADDYIKESTVKWNISKISDEYLPKNFPIPNSITEVATDKIEPTDDIIVEQIDAKSNRITTIVSALDTAKIVFNVAYFPGWELVVDGLKVSGPQVEEGKLTTVVQPGRHVVTAYFIDTPIRVWGNLVSLISLTVLFSLALKMRYDEKN